MKGEKPKTFGEHMNQALRDGELNSEQVIQDLLISFIAGTDTTGFLCPLFFLSFFLFLAPVF